MTRYWKSSERSVSTTARDLSWGHQGRLRSTQNDTGQNVPHLRRSRHTQFVAARWRPAGSPDRLCDSEGLQQVRFDRFLPELRRSGVEFPSNVSFKVTPHGGLKSITLFVPRDPIWNSLSNACFMVSSSLQEVRTCSVSESCSLGCSPKP